VVVELEPALERLRVALADLSLQFEATERLPVTISAGLCTYPEHGASVMVLLAAVARTLEEAKASGGDAIKVAGLNPDDRAASSGFDILQGLVLAVDTKDRYTKRHSEEVARYAVFLARRIDADPDLIRTISVAGLLHDVGKIGIPDQILRKPGKLTEAEYAIVKQHVALGDMIVRDLPNIELIRAGIRHHHERWDGAGYLHRLEGEGIPLVARILAVGDAFSAMTTTRPYRKALDIREALHRLEDAAGSQLDERADQTFVDGIATAADAPLPGADVSTTSLWTPRVA
jgi:putative nucleotidyltransferase with HDIG domain